jgi:LPS-assembly protein
MTGFTRRPLAVFICCLFAGLQTNYATADEPLRLHTERKFNVMGKQKSSSGSVVGIETPSVLKKDDTYPIFVVADRLEGQAEELTVAEGNVEMRKVGSVIFADRLTYHVLDDEIDAAGAVRVLQEGAEIDTPHLRMKLDAQIGSAEDVKYHILKETPSRFYSPTQTVVTVASSNAATSGAPMMLNVANSYGLPTKSPAQRPVEANGRAERVDFEGENQFTFFANTFSTCKPDREDWYMRASETHLDYDRNEGTASHASMWFGGVPFFYTPIASFSLNGQRRSGVLHPHFSTSTRSGIDFTVPYYWNIAPNYDMTLFPRYMSKRGFQLAPRRATSITTFRVRRGSNICRTTKWLIASATATGSSTSIFSDRAFQLRSTGMVCRMISTGRICRRACCRRHKRSYPSSLR